MQKNIVIIGAGPAGLTAAYLLTKQNYFVTVLEADPIYVGGIARTVVYKDYCFDIGGHRFFSKSKEVEDFWTEILPNDMLVRPRSSRIFYKKKFFAYPLNAMEVLRKLGVFESARCFLSYLKAKILPVKNPVNFTDWVSNHFGKRLFNIFFKTYTEKVWGMPCEEISADWAMQRIKGLSFWSAMVNAIQFRRKKNNETNTIKTLINSFRYPRKGPGMLWEVCADKIKQAGGEVILNASVFQCHFEKYAKLWEVSYAQGEETKKLFAHYVITSAPLRELVCEYLSDLPQHVVTAASKLKYRDFLIVVIILKDKNQFSDNWIYIHDPNVDVARIQNFKSWSPEMVPNENTCCYGMEYFCFQDDSLWQASDEVLIAKAKKEIMHVGLADESDILDGCVVRQKKAYPVYDEAYKDNVKIIREALAEQYPSLHLVGRNGMHKYNNQDHAMMTAMLTAENILLGAKFFDVWEVNQDAEYHEAGRAGEVSELGARDVPRRVGEKQD